MNTPKLTEELAGVNASAPCPGSIEYAVDFKIDDSEWRRWHPEKDTEVDTRAYAKTMIEGRPNHQYRIVEIVTTERILSNAALSEAADK